MLLYLRVQLLEEEMRNPFSICNVDCLLDTITALVNDCDHDSLKRLKNIEAYATKCKFLKFPINFFIVNLFK